MLPGGLLPSPKEGTAVLTLLALGKLVVFVIPTSPGKNISSRVVAVVLLSVPPVPVAPGGVLNEVLRVGAAAVAVVATRVVVVVVVVAVVTVVPVIVVRVVVK